MRDYRHQTPDKLLHVYSSISHISGKCEATRTGGETAKSTHTVVSRNKGDTKEDNGKSIKNVLYCTSCGVPKGTSWDEATSNSEKKSSP